MSEDKPQPPLPAVPGNDVLFRSMAEGATAFAIIAADPAGIITSWNIGAERLFGWDEGEAIGRPAAMILTLVNDADEPRQDMAKAVVDGSVEQERWHVRKDGSRFWASALIMPLADRGMGFLKIVQNRSEQRRTEEALRASEQRLATELKQTAILRDLAERLVTEERLPEIYEEILSAAMSITASDAGTVQVYDPETKSLVLLVTKGFDPKMTDYFHRVVAGSATACGRALQTGERSFADFDEDSGDLACRMHVEAGYHAAQATPMLSRSGAPIGMLNTHWRKPGHRPSESQLHFIDLLARQAGDLIDQRRAEQKLRASEERLRQFGEASQDVLWIRDADTLQWSYLTPAFEAIYGLSREEALGSNNFRS